MWSAMVSFRASKLISPYRSWYWIGFSTILFGLVLTAIFQFWPHRFEGYDDFQLPGYNYEYHSENIVISNETLVPFKRNGSCLFHTCFNVYHCNYNDDNKISVYIYPLRKYIDVNGLPIAGSLSKQYQDIIETVANSVYYTPYPERACLFLPAIDVLNQNYLRIDDTARVLSTLEHWHEDGENHLLFNMLPGSIPDYNTSLDVPHDKAIVAGGGYDSWTYRMNYDVSIPVFNPLIENVHTVRVSQDFKESRHRLLISSQVGLHVEYKAALTKLADMHHDFLLLDSCQESNFSLRCHGGDEYYYPYVLQESTFCLVIRGARLGQAALQDAMMTGCIPVIVADAYVIPFSEVLDWKRAAVVLREELLPDIMKILRDIDKTKIESMRRQLDFFWKSYFSSMKLITLTTLQIINDRVFPYAAKKYEEWNEPPNALAVYNPLFLPLIPPRQAGFTAVILTFDRLESLFKVIHLVSSIPSLSKILVVWNNQQKQPPPATSWPSVSKPLKVVQTRQNKLSNRFYPYDEIETEAILSLDDDILMLTPDEIEFGYEVWREFPDRLVGFPSRLHLWDNVTNHWKYISEWQSDISIVLTGAAFHHKYFSYLYTNSMPGNIKAWVDDHMNCEDIAMNFLISNITGKVPIKVTPRQKFKCAECSAQGMLSTDLSHMVERSECINRFAEIYGTMPLKALDFRVDPVLYKDNLPPRLKLWNDIGSL